MIQPLESLYGKGRRLSQQAADRAEILRGIDLTVERAVEGQHGTLPGGGDRFGRIEGQKMVDPGVRCGVVEQLQEVVAEGLRQRGRGLPGCKPHFQFGAFGRKLLARVAADLRVERFEQRAAILREGLVESLEFHLPPVLSEACPVAAHGQPGHRNDEINVGLPGRRCEGDRAALAVAEDSDRTGRRVAQRRQTVEGAQRVECELLGRGVVKQAALLLLRGSEAPVVVAQHGIAAAGQVVGDHQEGLVPENLLVAVLESAAGNQYHRGTGAAIRR